MHEPSLPNTTPISFGRQNDNNNSSENDPSQLDASQPHPSQSGALPNDLPRPGAPQREPISVEIKASDANTATQPDEPARPAAVCREQSLVNKSPGDQSPDDKSFVDDSLRGALPDDLVTVHEAVELFRTAGLERSIRTVQKYCSPQRKGRALKCHVTPTENGVRYMIERSSIENFVREAGAQAPVGKNDETEPDVAVTDSTPANVAVDDLAVYDHPYVKRLEQEIEKKETRFDDLQIRYENAMDMAQIRLVELQQASAVAQSESLGKFMLEAKRIDQGDKQQEHENSEIGDNAHDPHVPQEYPVSTPSQTERRQE